MRIFFILFLQVTLAISAFGQLHLDDPDYIYQSVDGTVLDKDKVNDLLHSRQHYSLKEKEQVSIISQEKEKQNPCISQGK